MPMSVQERTRKAAAASAEKARVRRFQRYLTEMRSTGLVVSVYRVQEGEPVDWHPAPEYLA